MGTGDGEWEWGVGLGIGDGNGVQKLQENTSFPTKMGEWGWALGDIGDWGSGYGDWGWAFEMEIVTIGSWGQSFPPLPQATAPTPP